MYAKSTRPSAKREVPMNGARSATIQSRAPGALKIASEASYARWECAREAGRFFIYLKSSVWFILIKINPTINIQKTYSAFDVFNFNCDLFKGSHVLINAYILCIIYKCFSKVKFSKFIYLYCIILLKVPKSV